MLYRSDTLCLFTTGSERSAAEFSAIKFLSSDSQMMQHCICEKCAEDDEHKDVDEMPYLKGRKKKTFSVE